MTRPFFAPRSSRWVPGNHFELLENGEEFFPRVFDAIAQARHEVMLETFILFEDKIGQQLHAALLGAAQRGVEVHVLVDGQMGFIGGINYSADPMWPTSAPKPSRTTRYRCVARWWPTCTTSRAKPCCPG